MAFIMVLAVVPCRATRLGTRKPMVQTCGIATTWGTIMYNIEKAFVKNAMEMIDDIVLHFSQKKGFKFALSYHTH